MLSWIVCPLVTIALWEYFGMNLDWHGVTEEELYEWGKAESHRGYVLWSFRIGPLEIFRM